MYGYQTPIESTGIPPSPSQTTPSDIEPQDSKKKLSWEYGRDLLDRVNFSKWYTYGTPVARNRNVNARFMFNRTKEYINNFRRQIQENLMSFQKKAQVWRSKLQSYPKPSKFGHIIYGGNNIQAIDFITNVLEIVEKEKGKKIKIPVQVEASF